MEEKITYFESPGIDNTEETLRLAAERAEARGINKIVLASTRGDTARLAMERFAGTDIKMVVVPHQYGFGETQRFPAELISELEQQGHRVHFGTMLFCAEIILMATDAGCVSIGEKVIAVTGTGRGADTAVVANASTSTKFSDFHITEIICKPLETRSLLPPPPGPGQPRP
jgi:hypothetical protein